MVRWQYHSRLFGAGWSSLVARRAHNPKVIGSNPVPATTFLFIAWVIKSLFSSINWADGPFFLRQDWVMSVSDKITNWIETPINSLGYELVGVEYISRGKDSVVRIYIDAEAGIVIEDCERVSHQVSGVLEVEDPISSAYTLEVSSPGFDRPLFKLADFERFAGEDAKVSLSLPIDGRRNFTGALQGVDGEEVLIMVDGEEYALPYGRISKARLVG